jgi:hypothetical protein
MRAWPRFCVRCAASLAHIPSTMSKFNTDTICITCAEEEREAPGYRHAVEIERLAVLNGNNNFQGVGLSPEDVSFLAFKRADRKAVPR